MITELQKKYLKENNIEQSSVGVNNLFTYPRYKAWESRELNKQEENQKMLTQKNESVSENPMPVTQAPVATVEKVVEAPTPIANQSPEAQQAALSEGSEQTAQAVPAPAAPQEPVPTPSQYANPAPAQSGFDALDNSGQIEKKQFDPTPYIGQDSFIEHIEERKGQYGYYIKLFSRVVDEGDWEIRASAIFGLEIDENGKLGWPPESKLFNFLRKHGVAHYRDLVANPITQVLNDDKSPTKEEFRRISGIPKTPIKIQTRQGKDGKVYLTFM